MQKSPQPSIRAFSRSVAKPLAASVAALLFATPVLHAATATWNTSVTTDAWDTAASWTSGTLPISTDAAYFANTAATTVTIAADAIQGLTFANTGTLAFSSGTLTIGSDGITRTGAGADTISSAVLLSASQAWNNSNTTSSLTVSGSIGASSTGLVTLTSTGAGSTTISGVIGNGAGTVALAQTGAGTLTLSAANTFSGGVTINAGNVLFSNASAFGTGTITLNGGTIRNTSAVTTTNAIVVNAASTLDCSENWTLSGNLSGTGNITRGTTATRSLYLLGDNSLYTGTFTIQNSSNSIVRFQTASSGFANGSLVVNQPTSSRTNMTFSSGTIHFGSFTGSGYFEGAGNSTSAYLEVGNLGKNETFSGALTGTMSLIKTGTGTWTLSGANTFTTGTTYVNQGTLQLGAGSTTGKLSASSGLTIGASGTLTINRSNAVAQGTDFSSAAISGSGVFVQAGSGTTTLSANNTYTGATYVNAGELDVTGTLASSTVNVNSGASLGGSNGLISNAVAVTGGTLKTTGLTAGSITFNGGSLVGSATSANISAASGVVSITGSAYSTGNFTVSGGTTTLGGAGSLNGVAGILVNGGTFIQNSSVALTPTVTVSQGLFSGLGSVSNVSVTSSAGTVSNISGGTLTIGSLSISSGTLLSNLTASTGGLAVTSFITGNTGLGEVVVSASNSSIWTNGSTYTLLTYSTLTGAASDFSLGSIYGLGVRQSAALNLTGNALTLTITGATPVWTGSTSSVWSTSTIGGASNWKLDTNNSATDFISGDIVTFDDSATATTVTINDGTVTPQSVIFNNATKTYTLTGTSGIQGTGSVFVNGVGTVIFDNPNTYTGATTISSGTLQIGNGGTTGSIANSSIIDNGALVYDRSDSLTQSTAISGSGSLTQAGAGTLILAGANSYTGVTTISSGTLQAGNGGSTGSIASSSAIIDNGALILNYTGNDTYSSLLSGTGSLTLSGGGLITILGNNSFSGVTTINSGTLQIGNGGANGSLASTSAIIDNGALVLNYTSTQDYGAAISGTGSVAISGSGTTTLSGSNSYTGATALNAGTLKLGSNYALGGTSGATTVASGATLDLNGYSTGDIVTLSGSGVGSNGALINSAATTGSVSIIASSSLTIGSGNIYLTNASSNSPSVIKNGSGTLTIGAGAGNINFTLNSGTTVLTGNSANLLNTTIINGGYLLYNATASSYIDSALLTGMIAGNLTMNGGTLDIASCTSDNNAGAVVSISGSGGTITNSGTAAAVFVTKNRGYNTTWGGNIQDGTGIVGVTLDTAYGSGTTTFTGTMTYSGATTIKGWNTLKAGSSTALSSKSAYSVSAGTIDLNGYDNTIGSLAGTTNGYVATGTTTGATLTTGGDNTSTTFAGVISGLGGIKKTGTGTFILSGANTYTGLTTISAGELDVNGSLAAGSTVGVNSGATLGGSGVIGGPVNVAGGTVGGSNLSITGLLTSTGASTLKGITKANGGITVASDTLSVTGTTTGSVTVNSGATLAGSGKVNGAVGVTSGTINGSGLTLTSASFSGNSRLTGVTSISGGINASSGTLSVAGANTTGVVTVNSGATLTGGGTVGGIQVDAGGTLALGTVSDLSAVTMISTGDVSFADATSTFAVRLGVSSATDSDVLSVSGGTVSLNDVTLSITLGDAFLAAISNGSLSIGQRWEIITNSDTSSSLLLGELTQGSTITSGSYTFTIVYGQTTSGATNNDVYVELAAVPEPSTWAMIVGGLGMLAFGRRFRRGEQN